MKSTTSSHGWKEKLKEDLVTYFQDFQNTSESSDDSANVVNAPREPFVVKQDHGVIPSHIDECCCECGDALDGIFCQQCTCKSYGKGSKIGYNCPLKVPIIYNPEPCNQTMNNELPQTLPSFDSTCYFDKENSILACCDDDVDYNSAITPVLSIKELDNSLSIGDEHLDTIPATESDEVIKSSVEDLVLIPTFYFDDDHIKEISSGSTTTHSDISLYEYSSFVFDLSNDQFPPTDRSDFTHEEFTDKLAHIISPSESDCFYFRNLPDPGVLISILNFGIRENLSSTTRVNLPVEDDYSSLLAYVVWIFLAYLTYPVIPLYLHSIRNKDTIFDLGIAINQFYLFKPGLSHRCGTFKKFNTHRSHLNESLMEMLFSTCFPMDQ
nr:hypothetical protein [Tanacetum cinerariifolium]